MSAEAAKETDESGRCPPRRGPFLIGVAGGTASGKSSVCGKIMERVAQEYKRQVTVICQDSFYAELSAEQQERASRGEYDFDHPDAFEFGRLLDALRALKSGQPVAIPKYSYLTNSRVANEETEVAPAEVILVEGILLFHQADLRHLLDIKIFVDTDSDTRLARRVLRDTKELGRDLERVLRQYEVLVKPAYDSFCLPTKKYADVIIPRGAENEPAIDLIVKHIEGLLRSPRGSPQTDHRTIQQQLSVDRNKPARPH